jgi:hypothetical protein
MGHAVENNTTSGMGSGKWINLAFGAADVEEHKVESSLLSAKSAKSLSIFLGSWLKKSVITKPCGSHDGFAPFYLEGELYLHADVSLMQ